jgi:hypothetical protein
LARAHIKFEAPSEEFRYGSASTLAAIEIGCS